MFLAIARSLSRSRDNVRFRSTTSMSNPRQARRRSLYLLGLTGSPITIVSNSCATGRAAIVHAPAIRAARLSPFPDYTQPEEPAVAAAECACLPSIETWVANSPHLRIPDGGYYGGGIEQPYKVGEYCCIFATRGVHLSAKNRKPVNNPYTHIQTRYDKARVLPPPSPPPRISRLYSTINCGPP